MAQLSGSQSTSASGEIMKLQLPEPWYEANQPDRPLSYVPEIEVRKLPNSPDNEFFFAALPYGPSQYSHEYQPDIPSPEYSDNSFAVTFTAPLRVRVATKEEWRSATRVGSKIYVGCSKGDADPGDLEYRGKKFKIAGTYCDTAQLSPRGQWLAIFSYSGKKTADWFFGGQSVKSGDIHWQIYNTSTGEKVFEWHAKNVKTPASLDNPVVWIEERHFLFPVDQDAQNFNVVTLPNFVSETNPVMIQLPSRINDQGQRIPAPENNEVWAPLVPLTPEQARKITAPQPLTLVEVRAPRQSSSRQLLFAIREETANEKRYRGGRGAEEGGDYNFRLFSTYYYYISPDDPNQTRFATKEEWMSAGSLTTRRGLVSIDDKNDTTGGPRRAYRQFPKTGTLGGDVLVGSSDWIAVVSYTPDSSSSGKMFVDIYEMRPGHKLSATELPYTGSPAKLFDNAFTIDREFLLMPLNASLETFALWKLP